MDAFQQEAVQSSCPLKKKAPSKMRREEARKNKYCLKKSNQFSAEKSEDKKLADNTKASKV